ncbi:type I restriction-modification enzyme R subunit C-terminal domain-containing protein [Spirabiliibacterium mucosae]|uniref:type I restriction-modification enzyme R subunit C-terminal domain-containing protein n=1 Tax=Spirabiliibacterium mucosae TaxID=28156 RepID=UPI001F44AEB6|nr:type I restriction-modification enzyme R subunit C-terminal domain-containing protein [Spirabiliibacterium mucosae]
MFADPRFDGDPLDVIDEKPSGEPNTSFDDSSVFEPVPDYNPTTDEEDYDNNKGAPVVGVGKVQVDIIHERVQILDPTGRLITESIKDYTKKTLLSNYASLDDFLQNWTNAAKRQAIIDILNESGVGLDILKEHVKNPNLDDFDLLCHIAFDKKPLTRKERAENIKKTDYLNHYEGLARDVLSKLIDFYADRGVEVIENPKVLQISPFNKMGDSEIISAFGGMSGFTTALYELRQNIYSNQYIR